MPHLTHSEPDWVSADTMSALVRYSVKLNCWSCADNANQSHTYILMPNESRKFYDDLEKGHDSEWGFLESYTVVRAVLLDNVTLQWVVITIDSNAGEMRLEVPWGRFEARSQQCYRDGATNFIMGKLGQYLSWEKSCARM